jgi:hypothetical protein
MSVDAPQSPQPTRTESIAAQVRYHDTFVVTDDDVADITTAGDQHANLTLDFEGEEGYLAGQFV